MKVGRGYIKDLLGQKFGKLLVIERTYSKFNHNTGIVWKCLCDCGNTKDVLSRDLTSSKGTKSCGCLIREKSIPATIKVNTKHGQSGTKEYMAKACRKYRYNLSDEQYQKMLKDQNRTCKICHLVNKGDKALNVDHNHQTGKIRGLLCDKCNRGIGLLNDDANLLRKAASYIEEHD